MSSSTAEAIQRELRNLDKENISNAITEAAKLTSIAEVFIDIDEEPAQPIQLNRKAFEIFKETWSGVSDEYCAQLFLEALHENS